jgi:hypothetical protein
MGMEVALERERLESRQLVAPTMESAVSRLTNPILRLETCVERNRAGKNFGLLGSSCVRELDWRRKHRRVSIVTAIRSAQPPASTS